MSDKLLWPVEPPQGLRGIDGFGSGAFHADRVASAISVGKKEGEEYQHQGLDLRAKPGSRILAWCDGVLLSSGYAYLGGAGDLRSIHIVGTREPFARFRFTLMYAKLMPELVGVQSPNVRRGQEIAIVQDVASFKMVGHTRIMVNHVHFEARRYNAAEPGAMIGQIEVIDPTELFEVAA
jgi:murein DD-endopeptidase MepM/ murein hydrolase activator NlpD